MPQEFNLPKKFREKERKKRRRMPLISSLTDCFKPRLSITFCFAWNCRNIPYQFKKWNKTEQISSHFKSRPVPDFSIKFRPERSDFIPHVPFRS
jgi:hypothetical protein